MSALILTVTAICILALAYRLSAIRIAARVLIKDDRNIVPSISCHGGSDHIPTNKWVVSGIILNMPASEASVH